jgi:4'-phosphopantetheinyl transferase
MLTGSLSAWQISTRIPELAGGNVHVWFAELDRCDGVVRRLGGELSADEYLRAMRFQFERDRNRYVVARSILRQILATYVSDEPLNLSFKYGPFGKPALGGSFADSELRFNVSHSARWAMFAVAMGREVGVDLECIRPINDLPGLAASCFTAAENAALTSIPEHERQRAFFDGWTRKEAFLKATGKGLSFPLKVFTVSLAPGSGWRELTVHEERGVGPEWTLISVPPPCPEFSAALVVEGWPCRVTTSTWPVTQEPTSNTHSIDTKHGRSDASLMPTFGSSELE